MTNLVFEEIVPTASQIDALYELLAQRNYGISHQQMPKFSSHAAFVSSHPYRYWYLILDNDKPIGSFYISNDNTIGIDLLDMSNAAAVESIFRFVQVNVPPLPAIKSVRADAYSINVSPNNQQLIDALQSLNAHLLQLTYSVPNEYLLNYTQVFG